MAILNYVKQYFMEFKWQTSAVAICSAVLIAVVTFQLTKPNKGPSVSLYYGNFGLNGQTIDATYISENHGRSAAGKFVLKDIRAEQNGRYRTSPVTVILYFSDRVTCEPGASECHRIAGKGGFLAGFEWSGLPPIDANKSWPVPVYKGIAQGSLPSAMKARLLIYYGETVPAEATFTVNVRKADAD